MLFLHVYRATYHTVEEQAQARMPWGLKSSACMGCLARHGGSARRTFPSVMTGVASQLAWVGPAQTHPDSGSGSEEFGEENSEFSNVWKPWRQSFSLRRRLRHLLVHGHGNVHLGRASGVRGRLSVPISGSARLVRRQCVAELQ